MRMCGRNLRTVLDVIITPEKSKEQPKGDGKWKEGQRVLVFNQVKKHWEPGRVMETTQGNVVKVLQNGVIRLRHQRHIMGAAIRED